jgi:lipopolysaccharide export system protein LptC
MNALTAVSDVEVANASQRTRHVYARFGRDDGDRVFRTAVRHSKYVRFLRIAIPVGVAVFVVGAVGLSFLLKPLSILAKLPVDVGSLVVSGTKIMMQQPRVAGFTKDNRRYVLTAQAAGQDVTKPDLVELHGIRATLDMKEQDTFETTAKDGVYNSKTELLTLTDDILVTSTSGYRAELSEAVVDMKAGRIVSEKPVRLNTSVWHINANRMEIAESGDYMRFDRGVTVVLTPQSKEQRPTTQGAAPPVTMEARGR